MDSIIKKLRNHQRDVTQACVILERIADDHGEEAIEPLLSHVADTINAEGSDDEMIVAIEVVRAISYDDEIVTIDDDPDGPSTLTWDGNAWHLGEADEG